MQLTKGVSLAYGLGSFIRVGENLIGFYLIYFLTTSVGLNAGAAGFIGGVSVLAGALFGPVFGRWSDRSTSRFGRRRPFMLLLAVPSMLLMTLLFVQVDLGGATVAYYFVVATVFAILYYGFLVPYDALGATLTEDPTRRAILRSICTGALYLSVLVGGTLVIQVQELFSSVMDSSSAWTVAVVLCCSIPGTVFALIAWRATRGYEPVETAPDSVSAGGSKIVLRLFTLRPVLVIIVWGAIYFIANTFLGSALIYLGVYVLGLDEGTASTLYMVGSIATFATVIFAPALLRACGKRNALILATGFFIVVSTIVYIIGPQGYITGAVLAAAYGVTNGIALVASYAMIYDLREVTELRLGQDLTGSVVGFFGLLIGVAAALALAGLGVILESAQFDPEGPAGPGVADTILALNTWIPSVLMVLASVALIFWNVPERAADLASDRSSHAVGVDGGVA